MKRYGQVIRVKADKIEEYRKYHADVWPEVLNMIKKCHTHSTNLISSDWQ